MNKSRKPRKPGSKRTPKRSVPETPPEPQVSMGLQPQALTEKEVTELGNDAQFISQSGIPSRMQPGQQATVTITMKNTGTTTWDPNANYFLGSQNPENNWDWGLNRIPLHGPVAPGQQKTFTFTITAPSQPGNAHFQWQMLQEYVEWFGDLTPNVTITVVAPPPQFNGARFVSQSGIPSTMQPGQQATVAITMKNIGTTPWDPNANYFLGSQNPENNWDWGLNRVALRGPVAPGQQETFTFTITGPSQAGDVNFQWRMVQEKVEWFGDSTPNVPITVVAVPDQFNGAQFISQSGIPSTMQPGQQATVAITMKNTGTIPWTADSEYKLGSQNTQDNVDWTGSPRVYLSPSEAIAPGQQKTFTFDITAPSYPVTRDFQWRMVQDRVGWFGDFTPNVQIAVRVPPPLNGAQFISQSGIPSTMQPGQQATVAITMKNTGTNPWDPDANYFLGSQAPENNWDWGLNRVPLHGPVAPGQQETFTFTITAPSQAADLNFQWRMVQEKVEWFGDFTPNVKAAGSGGEIALTQYRYHRIVCSYPRYSTDMDASSQEFGNIRFPAYGYWKKVNGKDVYYAKSQATKEYGERTRDLCIKYRIDAISGWWEPRDSQPLENFNKAFGSIDLKDLRIIYMFGVNPSEPGRPGFPSTKAQILTKVEEWAAVMEDRTRYAYITNANGTSCPILMIWGMIENVKDDAGVSHATKFKEMITGVRQIIQQRTGATPFIIMSQHNAVSAPFEDVLTSVDAFYQHEIHIPAKDKVFSTAESIDGTREMIKRAKSNLKRKKSAATGLPVQFIPGAMPQFDRTRFPGDDHGTVQAQSRSQVERMFRMVRLRAPTIWRESPADQPIEHKWVTITSLNEWPEGQTIEPSLVRDTKYKSPQCDYGEDFLELVRDVFK